MARHTQARTAFRDTGAQLQTFASEVLVVCPGCGACARVSSLDGGRGDWLAPRGPDLRSLRAQRPMVRALHRPSLARAAAGRVLQATALAADALLRRVLWFYNARHLALVERWVRASLRTKLNYPDAPWRNGTVIYGLPAWIQLAKNRREVTRAIERLKGSLVGSRGERRWVVS